MSEVTGRLLDEFFGALERGDMETVGALYDDDVQVWHNVTRRSLDKTASIDLLLYWCDKVKELRYEVLERHFFSGGAVQRHVVHGLADGSDLDAHICIVFGFTGNRISQIHEYLDAASVAAVFPGG